MPEIQGLSPWLSFVDQELDPSSGTSDISRTHCPRAWHGVPGLALASPAILGPAHRPFSDSRFLLEAQLFGGPGAELSVEGRFPE